MKRFLAFILTFGLVVNKFSFISYPADIVSDGYVAKIDSKIYEIAETKEKIPVCIWYEDINQEEVEVRVENEIGYSKEEIVSELPSISKEEVDKLYEANVATEETGKNILGEYLEENKIDIKREKEKTNKYISTRRNKAKDMYADKSDRIIRDSNIHRDVMLISKYAPMIIAELELSEIEKLSGNSNIITVEYFDKGVEYVECTDTYDFDKYIESSNIDEIHQEIGLDGNGINVGMVEGCNFASHAELPPSRCFVVGENIAAEHPTGVARIIAGTRGVAPGASIHSIALDSYGSPANPSEQALYFYRCVEDLIDEGVEVINCSFGYLTLDESYGIYDKWVDHIATMHNICFVVSAGNISTDENPNGKIMSPAKAFNAITVGACDNKNTEVTNDDIMFDYSCFDENNGVEKPDIIAAANIWKGGTSSAAPVVSGTIALLLQLRPSLAVYPDAVKAILMASCQYKALPASGDTQESVSDGLTDKQGAGVFSPYLSVCIVAQGNYGIGISEGLPIDINFYQHKYGASGLNFTITWLKNNIINSSSHEDCTVTEGDDNTLGLFLYKNGVQQTGSAKENTSAQMIYYESLDNSLTKYTARIMDMSYDGDSIDFAYAWCTNNETYQKLGEFEGLYYLKNKNKSNYLTYVPNTNSYQLSEFSNSSNQLFVVSEVSTLPSFNLLNGNITEGGVDYDNGEAVSNNTPEEIFVFRTNEGYYNFKFIGGLAYALNADSATTVAWEYQSNATNEDWVLEKIGYRLGDVNRDGYINSTDSNLILQYSARIIELYNAEKFLADMNGDNVIDNQDSLMVLQIAAGL